MARPGRIETVGTAEPPAPLCPAAGAVLLTLADHDTPIHLAGDADSRAVRDWLAFHTGAPTVEASRAAFAVGRWADLMPLEQYRAGTAAYPDQSVTLVVLHQGLGKQGISLCGPGIETTEHLALPDAAFLDFNAARFPLGIDMILTDGGAAGGGPEKHKTRRNGGLKPCMWLSKAVRRPSTTPTDGLPKSGGEIRPFPIWNSTRLPNNFSCPSQG